MSEAAAGGWFFTVSGQQKGPVSRKELDHLAKSGAIHPRNDMVWQEGMEKWMPACEIEGLFERRQPGEAVEGVSQMAATATNPTATDPYAVGDAAGEVSDFQYDATTQWPGVGRGGYIMATMVLPVVGQLAIGFIAALATGVIGEEGAGWLAIVGVVAIVVVALYAVFQRFPNLGMTRWWVLGLFVPILNWWLNYRCLACPPGYAFHKKLDGIGWVLAVLYWLSVVASLVMLVVLIVIMGATLLNPEGWQDIIEQLEAQQAGG